MTNRTITATHRQVIESAFPGHEIEVVFTVEAVIRHDDDGNVIGITFVPVMTISVNGEKPDAVVMPSEKTSDGRKFLALMREAVRQEAYRQQKDFGLEWSQMFPKQKPVQPGDDEYFYG